MLGADSVSRLASEGVKGRSMAEPPLLLVGALQRVDKSAGGGIGAEADDMIALLEAGCGCNEQG